MLFLWTLRRLSSPRQNLLHATFSPTSTYLPTILRILNSAIFYQISSQGEFQNMLRYSFDSPLRMSRLLCKFSNYHDQAYGNSHLRNERTVNEGYKRVMKIMMMYVAHWEITLIARICLIQARVLRYFHPVGWRRRIAQLSFHEDDRVEESKENTLHCQIQNHGNYLAMLLVYVPSWTHYGQRKAHGEFGRVIPE